MGAFDKTFGRGADELQTKEAIFSGLAWILSCLVSKTTGFGGGKQ